MKSAQFEFRYKLFLLFATDSFLVVEEKNHLRRRGPKQFCLRTLSASQWAYAEFWSYKSSVYVRIIFAYAL